MKRKALFIQLLAGTAAAFLLMWQRGLFRAALPADRVLIVCDGFTLVSFVYLGAGALMWVSTTGFFDIFGFAFKKAAHVLIPGLDPLKVGGYYEYRLGKQEKRNRTRGGSSLAAGLVFLVISLVLTAVWYRMQRQ